jgi:hypothetical protein
LFEEVEEARPKESLTSPNSKISSKPKLLSYDDLNMDWRFRHLIFRDNLFEKAKKADTVQALEDVVEAYLGELFQKSDVVYPSDVAAGLDLDYRLVQKLFAKFVRKGKLKG